MAFKVSQGVNLDVLADGTSTTFKMSTENLVPNSQIAGNPDGVEITNSGC